MYRNTTTTQQRPHAEPVPNPLAVAVRRVLSSQCFAAARNTLGFTAFSPTYEKRIEMSGRAA
jgi:hypothetical protein